MSIASKIDAIIETVEQLKGAEMGALKHEGPGFGEMKELPLQGESPPTHP